MIERVYDPRGFVPRWSGALSQNLLIAWASFLAWSHAVAAGSASASGADQALHWEQASGYRSAPLPVAKEGHAGFTRIPGVDSGILFTNELAAESGVRTQLRLAGS